MLVKIRLAARDSEHSGNLAVYETDGDLPPTYENITRYGSLVASELRCGSHNDARCWHLNDGKRTHAADLSIVGYDRLPLFVPA